MRTRVLLALLAGAAVATMALSANAEPKDERKGDRKEVKEDRKDVKEAKDDLKEANKNARQAARDGGGDAAAVKEARMKLGEARKELKESREERRKNARVALRAKWGDLADKPAVRAELRLHAQRMAKLRMMKNVADDADKKNLEERVDKLIDKEKARHQARVDALKAKNGEDAK